MEEQHDQEEEYVEEQSVPLQSKPITINKKTGLPRKVLDEAALSKLAKAREKANAIREENRLKKLEQKVKDMKIKKNIKEEVVENELKEEVKENELKEQPEQPEQSEEPEEEEPPKIIKKKIKKKKPVVIVEQSSDDEDEFEPNEKVLFVKRVSRKKKEKEPEAPRSEPTQEYELPPPDIPKPPIRQKPTLLEQQYNAMFSGSFLNQQRRRF